MSRSTIFGVTAGKVGEGNEMQRVEILFIH